MHVCELWVIYSLLSLPFSLHINSHAVAFGAAMHR